MKNGMKKALICVLSLIIAFVMLAPALVHADGLADVYASAKDGDLLYELKFDGKDGIYTPELISADIQADRDNKNAFVTSDGGRTLTFQKAGDTSGSFWYGGQIKGLTYGEGKSYTVTMQVRLPKKRSGLYVTWPSASALASKGYVSTSFLYGFYGKFDSIGDIGAMQGGGRIKGEFKWNTDAYVAFDPLLNSDMWEFNEVTFLLEDYSYAVFLNGIFLDRVVIGESEMKGKTDEVGFSVYIYHYSEPLVVKNVNVYKGDTVSKNAVYPKYAAEYPHYNVQTEQVTETTAEPEIEAVTTPEPTESTVEENKGCTSAISGIPVALICLTASFMLKKKNKK